MSSLDARRAHDIGDFCDRLFALAAATGTAKTPQAVECEASQSGPKGNAQNQSSTGRECESNKPLPTDQ